MDVAFQRSRTTLRSVGALLIGVALLVTACAGRPPDVTMVVGDVEQTGTLGGYCWDGLIQGICADGPIPVPATALTVPSQFTAEFDVPGEPDSVRVHTIAVPDGGFPDPHHAVAILVLPEREASSVNLDLDPGRYLLLLSARWRKGDGSYGFLVEVR